MRGRRGIAARRVPQWPRPPGRRSASEVAHVIDGGRAVLAERGGVVRLSPRPSRRPRRADGARLGQQSSVVAVRPPRWFLPYPNFSIAMVVRAPRNLVRTRDALPGDARGGSLLDDLECPRKATMRAAPSPSSTTISPDERDSASATSVISCPHPPHPPWMRRGEVGDGEVSTGLDLAAMMPLKEGSGARPRRRSRPRAGSGLVTSSKRTRSGARPSRFGRRP